MKIKEMQSDAKPPKREVRMKDGLDFETIQQIEKLSGLGLTQPQIAYVMNMKPEKFQWYLRKDSMMRQAMDRGVALANAQVARTLFKLATSGECPAATFFWAKTRMGWSEVNQLQVSVKPDVVYRSTVRADGSLIQEVIEDGKVIDVES